MPESLSNLLQNNRVARFFETVYATCIRKLTEANYQIGKQNLHKHFLIQACHEMIRFIFKVMSSKIKVR